MERKNIKTLIGTTLLIFFYLLQIIGFHLVALEHLFRKLLPLNFLFTGCILFAFHRKTDRNFLMYSAIVMLLVFLMGFINEHTGMFFGNCHYGEDALGWQIAGVPLMVMVLWLIFIYSCCCMAWRSTEHSVLRPLAVALLMVLLDIFIEPVAMQYDLWHWDDNDVPFRNYLAWFITSFFMAVLFFFMEVNARNRIARYVYLVLLAFFVALNLI